MKRNETSIIHQDVFCFNSSIVDNITMFRCFPDEKQEEAIHNAGCLFPVTRKGTTSLR